MNFIRMLAMILMCIVVFLNAANVCVIPSSGDPILIELAKQSCVISQLSADVSKLSADFSKLSADVSKLSADVSKLSADVSKLIDLDGQSAYEKLKEAAQSLTVDPPTTGGNSVASGSYVFLDGKYFSSSMRHLFFQKNKKGKEICKRKLLKITDSQGQSIKFNHDEIIVSDKYDLALIPISEQKKIKALNVSKEPLKLGEKLFGVSLRETGFVAIDCMIHELKDLFADSNAGGTHGFSGMSYGNSSGTQRGLHKGQGEMNQMDDDGDEYSGFNEAEEDFSDKCKKAFANGTKDLINSCVEANIEFVKIAARNPRTRIVEAYHLYETKNVGKLLKNVILPEC